MVALNFAAPMKLTSIAVSARFTRQLSFLDALPDRVCNAPVAITDEIGHAWLSFAPGTARTRRPSTTVAAIAAHESDEAAIDAAARHAIAPIVANEARPRSGEHTPPPARSVGGQCSPRGAQVFMIEREAHVTLALEDALLVATGDSDEYLVHLAACDWRRERPLLIRGEMDINCLARLTFKPYAHQVRNLVTFSRRAPVALLADDVGLGKTVSAGLILTELMARNYVKRALVICPKSLVDTQQWQGELENKFNLRVLDLAQALGPGRGDRGVTVVSYETARSRIDDLANGGFQMVLIDEAHRLRRLHSSANNPPKFATAIRDALESRSFKYVLLLTATPIQNCLWDLYSLIDFLVGARGHPHPLGSRDDFKAHFLGANKTQAIELNLRAKPRFNAVVRDYIARTGRNDANLAFPSREVRLLSVEATAIEAALIQLVRDSIDKINALSESSLLLGLMSSPRAFLVQLENMVQRNPDLGAMLRITQQLGARDAPSAKLGALMSVIGTLQAERPLDWRVVVFTGRKETQGLIADMLLREGIPHGLFRGGAGKTNAAAVAGFTAEPPTVRVLVLTDAGNEGLNLQAANVLVNYDLPWNPMVLEQRIGRVQRLGSRHGSVVIFNLTVKGTVEEKVVQRLLRRLQMIGDSVGGLDAILSSAGSTEAENIEKSMHQLVIASLRGQDLEKEIVAQEQSWSEAHALYDENRERFSAHLAGSDALHSAGPEPPFLPFVEPRMTLRELVPAALRREGFETTEVSPGRFGVRARGGKQQFIVTGEPVGEEVQSGDIVYALGERDFESLTQRWAARSAALVRDIATTDAALRAIVEAWCAALGGATLLSLERGAVEAAFQGEIELIARASVDHDTYERPLPIVIHPAGHHALTPAVTAAAPTRPGGVRASQCVADLQRRVEASVAADPSIAEFRRFYEQRRDEDLRRVEAGSKAAQRIHATLTPTVKASVVGVSGVRYEIVEVRIRAQIDQAIHAAHLRLVPATGQVIEEPERGRCASTSRSVPVGWLERCAESGQLVLSHLLVASEFSAQRALPELMAICVVSGKRMLHGELGVSDVSGARAHPSYLRTSPVSGRKGTIAELATCEITGVNVLNDELEQSQISGKLYRKDEKARSAVSGVEGHRAEFVQCAVTRLPLLLDECGRSDVSGKLVRKDLLVASDRPPHRRGLSSEMVACARTRRRLLRDEVAASAASGLVVDKLLLVASDRSGLLALPDELLTCPITGHRLLRAETEKCAVTGIRVDIGQLQASEVSGLRVLPDQLARCAITRKQALPSELVECDLTGARVLPSTTEQCSVSGLRARRDRMVKSVVSSLYLAPGSEVRSVISGLPMAPSEVFRCAWSGDTILPGEAKQCALTGAGLSPRTLNAAGELGVLRLLLNDPTGGEDAATSLAWLKPLNEGSLAGAHQLRRLVSPTGEKVVFVAEVKRFLFWQSTVGFTTSMPAPGATPRLFGKLAIGKRKSGTWERTA